MSDFVNDLTNNDDELSATLLERRKRLHDLATEINKWEDESLKKANIPQPPPLPHDLLNATRIINSPNRKSFTSQLSPFGYQKCNNDSGISIKMQKMNETNNKENVSINNETINKQQQQPKLATPASITATKKDFKSPLTQKQVSLSAAASTTHTNNQQQQNGLDEIAQVAKKILSKKEIQQTPAATAAAAATTANSVRTIKEKFESIINQSQNDTIENEHLTPKLLIKKFEAMSKDGGLPLTGSVQPPSTTTTTAATTTTTTNTNQIRKSNSNSYDNNKSRLYSFLSQVENAVQSSPKDETRIITKCSGSSSSSSSSNKNKFESIKKVEKQSDENLNDYIDEFSSIDDKGTTLIDDDDDDDEDEDEQEEEDEDDNDIEEDTEQFDNDRTSQNSDLDSLNNDYIDAKNKKNQDHERTLTPNKIVKNNEDSGSLTSGQACGGQLSLTYVSSLPDRMREFDYENDTNKKSYTHKYGDEPIYEELNANASAYSVNDEAYVRKQQIIRNFRLEVEDYGENDIDDFEEYEEELNRSQDTYSISTESSATTVTTTQSHQTGDTCSLSSYNDKCESLAGGGGTNTNNENDDQASEMFSIKDYRKQKQSKHTRQPRRSLLLTNANIMQAAAVEAQQNNKKQEANSGKSSISEKSKNAIVQKIKELEELIKQEDNKITQTGSALEKCYQNSQFNGSIEHIECNRILLIACQKRQSYLTEITRLKQKLNNSTTNQNDNDEIREDLSGTLIFSDLQLPLKESYMNKLRHHEEKRIFHFICLLRHGIQVLQTQVISVQELLSTKDNMITFTNRMAISNVDVNFKVKIDVYAMEELPKEKPKKSPTRLNPTKFFSPFKTNVFNHGHHESNSTHQTVVSGIAKTSNFIHIDTIDICHKDVMKENFKLNISSSSIPLIGVLHLQIRCMPSKSIELRGFLTMFEDVSGFGSWDRRWCMLSNSTLSYWKYPEDEFRKSPIGCINLIECITDKAYILSRDTCARKYTFELVCVKTRDKNDEYSENGDSLISKSYDKFKFTKYWLSADTKENANDWLNHINWALTNLRLWNPNAVKPIKKSTTTTTPNTISTSIVKNE